MDRLGDGETADTPRLDVDDLPRAELDHVGRTIDVGDRFVETNARLEAPLQLGVPNDVIAPQRLLDHDEVERVELGEVIGVGERVSGVRVGHEMDVLPTPFAPAPSTPRPAPAES